MNMDRRLLHPSLLLIILIHTGCATLFNGPNGTTTIYHDQPFTVVHEGDTFDHKKGVVDLKYKRSQTPLEIEVITDSGSNELSLPARNAYNYHLNALPGPFFLWGYLVDRNRLERAEYPYSIYLQPEDEQKPYRRFDVRNRKGDLDFQISLPYVNHFRLLPDYEQSQVSTGFLGVGMGLDYHHADKQYLNLAGVAALDFPLPFPAAFHRGYGSYTTTTTAHIGLTNNHRLGMVHLGYGFVYAYNGWHISYAQPFIAPGPEVEPSRYRRNNSLGGIINCYLQVGDFTHIGLFYRPTYLRFSDFSSQEYEHMISFEIKYKFPVLRGGF